MSEPVLPCDEDHMHEWHLSATHPGWICTNQTRDTPEPVLPDAQMAHIIESYEWISVGQPMLTNLNRMIADAKKDLVADVQSSVLADLPRNPVGLRALFAADDDENIDVIRDIWGGSRPFMDFLHFKTSTRGRDMLTYQSTTTQKVSS